MIRIVNFATLSSYIRAELKNFKAHSFRIYIYRRRERKTNEALNKEFMENVCLGSVKINGFLFIVLVPLYRFFNIKES